MTFNGTFTKIYTEHLLYARHCVKCHRNNPCPQGSLKSGSLQKMDMHSGADNMPTLPILFEYSREQLSFAEEIGLSVMKQCICVYVCHPLFYPPTPSPLPPAAPRSPQGHSLIYQKSLSMSLPFFKMECMCFHLH